jgi:hypothetical protein
VRARDRAGRLALLAQQRPLPAGGEQDVVAAQAGARELGVDLGQQVVHLPRLDRHAPRIAVEGLVRRAHQHPAAPAADLEGAAVAAGGDVQGLARRAVPHRQHQVAAAGAAQP